MDMEFDQVQTCMTAWLELGPRTKDWRFLNAPLEQAGPIAQGDINQTISHLDRICAGLPFEAQAFLTKARSEAKRWLGLFEQRSAKDKWIVCRFRCFSAGGRLAGRA